MFRVSLSRMTREAIIQQWRLKPDQTCKEVVRALAEISITILPHHARNHRPPGLLPPMRLDVKGARMRPVRQSFISDPSKLHAIDRAWADNPNGTIIEILLWLRQRGIIIYDERQISCRRPDSSQSILVVIDPRLSRMNQEEISEKLTIPRLSDPTPNEIEKWKEKIKWEKSFFHS